MPSYTTKLYINETEYATTAHGNDGYGETNHRKSHID